MCRETVQETVSIPGPQTLSSGRVRQVGSRSDRLVLLESAFPISTRTSAPRESPGAPFQGVESLWGGREWKPAGLGFSQHPKAMLRVSEARAAHLQKTKLD